MPVLTSSTLEISVLSRLLQRGDENCMSKLETKIGNNYGVIQDVTVWFNWCVCVCMSAQSSPTVFFFFSIPTLCSPMDCSPPDSAGISGLII